MLDSNALSTFLQALLQALCLVLIIEGIIPFINPKRWRMLVAQLSQINDLQLRIIGLVSMLLGVFCLFLLR